MTGRREDGHAGRDGGKIRHHINCKIEADSHINGRKETGIQEDETKSGLRHYTLVNYKTEKGECFEGE